MNALLEFVDLSKETSLIALSLAEVFMMNLVLPKLVMLGLTACSVILAVMTGIISAGFSVIRVSNIDIHRVMKGD